jgi:hypothetical protein
MSGTTEWLNYQTDLIPLAVGEAIRRTFTVTVPADTGPGEYITSIVLENDLPLHSTGAVGLNQIIRQAVAVVVTVPGPRRPGIAIGAASHKVVAGRSIVSVALDNSGNVRLKPLVGYVLLDAKRHTSEPGVSSDGHLLRQDRYLHRGAARIAPAAGRVHGQAHHRGFVPWDAGDGGGDPADRRARAAGPSCRQPRTRSRPRHPGGPPRTTPFARLHRGPPPGGRRPRLRLARARTPRSEGPPFGKGLVALGAGPGEMVEMGENRTPRPEPSRRERATGVSGLFRASLAGPQPAGCSARYPADLSAL